MKNRQRNITSSDTFKGADGFILIISLLSLLALTAIGILAISTSTTEVMIAGNTRLREIGLSAADSGIELTEPILRNTDNLEFTDIPQAELSDRMQDLRAERNCVSQLNPDTENFPVSIGGNNNVSVDVDYVSAGDPGPGYALEEGGPPIVRKNYIINATSRGASGSETRVGAVYFLVGWCD
ncbi:MAG: PilX N-terminal domain-containing pilus assembly protein [Nitrospirota bacterium]|nr:PilX N-terminal domain-containing pilus assembly protein [Nitrospirota bacterium]